MVIEATNLCRTVPFSWYNFHWSKMCWTFIFIISLHYYTMGHSMPYHCNICHSPLKELLLSCYHLHLLCHNKTPKVSFSSFSGMPCLSTNNIIASTSSKLLVVFLPFGASKRGMSGNFWKKSLFWSPCGHW